MQHRPLGRTGLQVSALGFGAMRLPTLAGGAVDLEKSVPILRRGLDLGINYIDSAYVYLNGTSEVAVGQAIKGYDRNKVYIATKIRTDVKSESTATAYRAKFEESLRRLDTPYIDVMQIHGLKWAEYTGYTGQPGYALETIRRLRDEGLVRHIGFSCHDTAENVIRLIDTGEFEAMLVQYNALDRHNEEPIAHAAAMGMGVAVMGPVAGGRLVQPRGSAGADTQITGPELALRFVWNNPNVSVALSGMNAIPQVEQNVAAANRLGDLSQREQQGLVQLVTSNQKLADLYCTGCGYCMPCPHEVNIPENFRYMNWRRVWGLEKEAQEAYAKLSPEGAWGPWVGNVTGRRASECQKCGECEPKCPQNIPIMEQLEEVADTLGK
jgi:uncharacterized protein